jgi:hypothetical protein
LYLLLAYSLQLSAVFVFAYSLRLFACSCILYLPVADCRLRLYFVYAYSLWLMACSLWLAACGLQLVACSLWLAACGLQLVAVFVLCLFSRCLVASMPRCLKKGREETSLNLLNQSPRNLKVNPLKLTFHNLKT